MRQVMATSASVPCRRRQVGIGRRVAVAPMHPVAAAVGAVVGAGAGAVCGGQRRQRRPIGRASGADAVLSHEVPPLGTVVPRVGGTTRQRMTLGKKDAVAKG